ncbi:MAG: LysM peptidoglycan-binding domain-containing protein [Verrucomicrobiaceae bacterium]|jgi:LysM repeat protein|nr:LysM peptidoglycan-binding domain-containing protein [Verrucomicrobiaceae bacterium]
MRMNSTLWLTTLLPCAVLAAFLPSCTGPTIKGLPKNLPVINLHGSKETPPHSMAKNEYPFDENGDYKTSWVSGGSAPEADYRSWRSSHGGEPTPHRDYKPPAKKKSTSSKSKSKSSKGGSYTIKPGDSLSTIAARNGTTVAKLKAANGLKSDLIRAGKTLKIPK